MRIGIYLGRHAGRGGGAGVFARSFVVQAISAISRDGSTDIDLVVYGDRVILDGAFLERLSLLPELIEVADYYLDRGAGNFFRTLPNGARLRVVLRRLPSIVGRRTGLLSDQFFLPLLLRRDKIDLLHSLADIGITNIGIRGLSLLATPVPQLVTIHDLFQAFPAAIKPVSQLSAGTVKESKDPAPLDAGSGRTAPQNIGLGAVANDGKSGDSAPTWAERFYRTIFSLQFRAAGGADIIATDSAAVAAEIFSRYRFPVERISVVPLGLDEYFADFVKVSRSIGIKSPLRRYPVPEKPSQYQLESESRLALSQQRDWAGPGGGILRELDRLFELEPGYILVFGSSEPRKNLEQAISAWFSHFDLFPHSRLVITAADRTTTRQIEAIVNARLSVLKNSATAGTRSVNIGATQNGIESQISVLQWVEREDLPLLLAGAGVLLHPTLAGGFALPVIEAFAVGTPVVSPRLDSVVAAIETNMRLHFECLPESVDSIAAALNRAAAANYGEGQCADPQPRTIEHVVREYLTLYRKMELQYFKKRAAG